MVAVSAVAEAIEVALRLGEGVATVLLDQEERVYATARACPDHPEIGLPELLPLDVFTMWEESRTVGLAVRR